MNDPKSSSSPDSTLLRRSSRVSKPRTEIEIIFGAERPYKKRAKTKSKRTANKNKNLKLTANSKGNDENNKLTQKHLLINDKNNNNKRKLMGNRKHLAKKKAKTIHESIDSKLTKLTWSTYAPLLSQDFKNQVSVISRLKSPNTKFIPYAGSIIKIMSFINKFYNYFGSDILCLSFQDFEIGLNLYPSNLGSSTINKDGIFNESKQRYELYQDLIPVIEVKKSQDKMNLLLYSLLKILFTTNDANFGDPAELNILDPFPKKQLRIWLEKLRNSAHEWGYPREWRRLSSHDRTKFERPLFEKDDTSLVDNNLKEILTPNVYKWPEVLLNDIDDDPIMDSELENSGLLSVDEPMDRLIFLRVLVDWCISNSPLIHDCIYRLSHMKGEPSFGVQTQHVPRFFIEGPEKTMKTHIKSCLKFLDKMDTRFKNKHYKKLLKENTQPDLRTKEKVLIELREILSKAKTEEEKEELVLSMADKWEILFKNEIYDNPLKNAYHSPIYQLRAQEFFIGRVPFIGDFYIPRLHSYGNDSKMNTFTDLRSLTLLLDNFEKGAYDSYTLFDNYGQNMSAKFKVLYHDTPSMLRDMSNGLNISSENYWYEMCHDSTTLKEFLELLDYKIAPPPKKEKTVEPIDTHGSTGTTENSTQEDSIIEGNGNGKVASSTQKDKKVSTYDTSVNKHSLPRDIKYNISRERLQIMRDYLAKMYYIFKAYEELKEKFGNMQPGKRQLRSTRRQNYVDEYVASDTEDYVANNDYDENEDDEDGEEEELDDGEEEELDDGEDDEDMEGADDDSNY